jgi:LacI family transcriptional regulator
MSERAGPATIRDVALRAGVSTATVSRVLAGIGNPKVDTVASVMTAVEALDYRPSSVARSLRMKRTSTFGLIITDIANPFFPELVKAADDAARLAGYSIVLGSSAYEEHRAVHYLDLMADRRVDGLIVASSLVAAEAWEWLAHAPVPSVVVNVEPTDATATVITSDNEGGMRLATEHLISLGHTRLAHITGAFMYNAAVVRLKGFLGACAAAGLDPDTMPILQGDGQFEGGEAAAARLIAEFPDVTGVVCYNDLTAIGVLAGSRAAGRSVPGDLSIIGCDDIAPASWVSPALSTVAQQKGEMGRLAVERLIDILDNPDANREPEIVRLPMLLRSRGTTDRVRADGART